MNETILAELQQAWRGNTIKLLGLIGIPADTDALLSTWTADVQESVNRPSSTFLWDFAACPSITDFRSAIAVCLQTDMVNTTAPSPTPCSQAPILIVLKGLDAVMQSSAQGEGILVSEFLANWLRGCATGLGDALCVFASTLMPVDLGTSPGYTHIKIEPNPHIGQNVLEWLDQHLASDAMKPALRTFYKEATLAQLYGQTFQHQDAHLLLNKPGAERLLQALQRVVDGQQSEAVPMETSDGESYTLHLQITNDPNVWEAIDLPYTDVFIKRKGGSPSTFFGTQQTT